MSKVGPKKNQRVLWTCIAVFAACFIVGLLCLVQGLTQGSTVRKEEVFLYPNETADLGSILSDEKQLSKVSWESDDENVVLVNAQGKITAKKTGSAKVVARENNVVIATCSVSVSEYEKATMTPVSVSLPIGGISELKVSLPSGVEVSSCEWTSSCDDVASVDPHGATAFAYAWQFGSATISVIVTDSKGTKYQAESPLMVTADYFYLVGLNGNWDTYTSEDAAQDAGVLLTAQSTPSVFSITADIKANEGFEILHSGIGTDWWTKITPYWYSAAGSTDEYVSNNGDMFMVNTNGQYTITLDLTDGPAKVLISLVKVYVSEIDLTYKNNVSVLSESADLAVIGMELYPKDASVEFNEIVVTKTGDDVSDPYVAHALNRSDLSISVLLVRESDTEIPITFTVQIGDVQSEIQIIVAPTDIVLPTSISFDATRYEVDVNNGGLSWTTTVHASVDGAADVKEIRYSSDEITVDPFSGEVTASGLGVFSVTAMAVGNPNLTATTEVVVYSSGFYLIGLLDGQILNDWNALPSSATSLYGTAFDAWGLSPVNGSLTEYSGTFYFKKGDLFSIVFLGMSDSWADSINNRYFDAEASGGNVAVNGTNIEILQNSQYCIHLDLSGTTPSFTVEWINDAEFEFNLYLMRSGFSWLAAESDEANILMTAGALTVDGQTSGQTITFRYNFSDMDPKRPINIQFLTASEISGGYLYNATWYGTNADPVVFSGDAYSATGTTGYFKNNGCELVYVNDYIPTNLTVEFIVTFDADGNITEVELTFVYPVPIVTSVQLTRYTTSMRVGESYQFAALVRYSNGSTSGDVIWTTGDGAVLEIYTTGLAVAHAPGYATITATAGGVSASVMVRVSNPIIPVESTVKLTSYTSVMNVDEEFEFAALVTYDDGTTSTEVTWESSDIDVIDIDETGYAYASAEGEATITATAGDVSASIDVLVSDEAILVEGVTLNSEARYIYLNDENKIYQLVALVLPQDATDKTITWKSSDESVATVDENGLVTAIALGEADITVTTNDHMFTATCKITVIDEPYGEATLSAESLTLKINEMGLLAVTLPEGGEADTYVWSSSVGRVATPSFYASETASIYTWGFGTTIISVIVTDTDGLKYQASATVLVTADYFYLAGMNNVWDVYDTEAGAEGAGVLLTPVDGQPNVYSITRSVWAYQNFQIIHSGIDEAWTTKITPYWYSADGSSDAYVDNLFDFFRVTTYGAYTITLDLNDGEAKVFIEMQDIYATEINFSFTGENTAVLTAEKDTTDIHVEILPANASYNPEDVVIRVTDDTMEEGAEGESEYVSYTYDAVTMIITVTAEKFPETGAVTVYVTVTINEGDVNVSNASNSIRLMVASATAVAPTEIAFTQEVYPLDLNNGGKEWTTTVTAIVNEDADLDLVRYSTEDSGIYVDPLTGEVSAAALGVYTVKATAVGDTSVTATAQIVVYSSAFYLIGLLDQTIPNDWIALNNETYLSLEGTEFAKWGLTAVDGSLTEYTGEFDLDAGDLFSIIFLGMDPGSWYGAVNSAYFDTESSTEYAIVNGMNIKILANGTYRVNLTLDSDGPHFNVELVHLEDVVPYELHVYLMRAWYAWDSSVSAVENTLIDGGYVEVNGEGGKTVTFTYNFSGMQPCVMFQFLTAPDSYAGFINATWYGADATDIDISGSAYGNEYGKFYNGGDGCLFWYVGDETPREVPTVEFTITFNAAGRITAIEMNFVDDQG